MAWAEGAEGVKEAGGTLANGNARARGGARPGAGRKPDEVKALERRLMDTEYLVPDGAGGTLKNDQGQPCKGDLGTICILRLLEIAYNQVDLGAAAKACDSLLNRKFGRPAQKIEMSGKDLPTLVIGGLSPDQASKLGALTPIASAG